MKGDTMKQQMQWLAGMIVTGLLFAAAENGQAQLKNPSGGVYLPAMKTNGPAPSLAHAFDGLTVNGETLKVNSVADLQTALTLLQSDPPVPMASVPKNELGGVSGIGFWSLQNPDWPPLPGDTIGMNVWPIGSGSFVLDDTQYNYNPAPKVKAKTALTSDLAPPDPGGGTGDTNTYDLSGTSSAVSYSTNDLWLQIVGQNNSVSSLVIHTPWNVTGSNFMFDVFATTNLLPTVPGLNGTNWMFVTRGLPGQTNLFVSPMPNAPVCFYRLGTLLDSDNDGLTDAFEKLVSHTDPNLWDSNGNGIGDGDELSPSGLPWRLMQTRPSSAVVFADISTATQGGGCGEATVYLPTPAPAGGTTVQFYLGGTAVLGTDYSISPNPLFIPQNSLSGTISVCALGANSWSDLDLYADITLTNAGNYYVDGTPARVNILQTGSPGVRVFALPSWSRRPCTTYGTNVVGFYFIRDGDSTNALTVKFSLSGSAVTSYSDFYMFPAVFTFPANVRTNWVPVTLVPNNTNPADSILTLTITNAPGYQIDPTNGMATLTIAAAAAPVLPTVAITSSILFAAAGSLGQFTITRSPTSSSPLRVYLNTWSSVENVTGRSGTNDTTTYNALPDYVDIAPNTTSTNIPVTVNNSPSQAFPIVATLSAGDYSIDTNNTATATVDVSGAPTVNVTLTRTGAHGAGINNVTQPAELTFTRSGSVAAPLKLYWYFTPGTGLNFYATSATLAGFLLNGSNQRGTFVLPAGQSVIRTNLSIGYQWNPASSGFENDDYAVYSGILFSNASYYATTTFSFVPSWEVVRLSGNVSPAIVVTNGATYANALHLSRQVTGYGAGPRHGLSVTISTAGSAVNGTDYSLTTSVNFGTNQTDAYVPVTALTNTNQGWRTLVTRLDAAVNNNQCVPDATVNSAMVRLANPNNLIDDTDIDGDGIPDGFEIANSSYGLDPLTPDNPNEDIDRDGIGLMDELSLGLNPNVADSPPQYPSIEDTDYVNLNLRIGASGKMLPTSQSCALCHSVSVLVDGRLRGTGRTDWTHNPRVSDYLVRLVRGTNYPVQITAYPASSLLTSNQAAATTSPKYTAAYVAQFWANSNSIYPFIIDTNRLLGTNLSMVKEVLPKRATLYIPDLTIATDNDRDGIVNFKSRADRTSATNPFAFWINDDSDADGGTTNLDLAQDNDPSQNSINSADNKINGVRDLEDFARLQFKIDGLPLYFLTNGNYQIKLYVTNLSGTPSFRLFPAYETNGGIGYLTNLNTAFAQLSSSTTSNMLGVATGGTPLTIPNYWWYAPGTSSYMFPTLFEGVSTGSCIVTFGFSSNNAPPFAVSRPFYLNLKKATDLYEHWTVGDNNTNEWNTIPARASRTADSAIFGNPKADSDLDYILFVHGWRMQPWERRAFASTAFKRLWQEGYKGRFGLYSWPTDWVDDPLWQQLLDPRNFNRSERRARDSGRGLDDLISRLYPANQEDQGRVRIMAHSMGNIVVSEALLLRSQHSSSPLVQDYIASQAASAAHAYDAVGPETLTTYAYRTPEIYAAFPATNTVHPYFSGMKNAVQKDQIGNPKTFNYHNKDDYALNKWLYNQGIVKPDIGFVLGVFFYSDGWDYSTNYPANFSAYTKFKWDINAPIRYNVIPLYTRKNSDEILSHIAQARCRALGAAVTPGYIVGGEIGSSVDLNVGRFNYKGNDYEHSAEFRSVIMKRWTYFDELLKDTGIK
jgi:hypothetical protein